MTEVLRFKDFEQSEIARLRSEIARLRAQLAETHYLLDGSIDAEVELKFSLEEATGVPQN